MNKWVLYRSKGYRSWYFPLDNACTDAIIEKLDTLNDYSVDMAANQANIGQYATLKEAKRAALSVEAL
ncbi:hypothetical protein HAP94_04440 [Acidithiobacillus ferrivorans]|nr:hypothetical protein [Acidithiobacillus ferrivorans]